MPQNTDQNINETPKGEAFSTPAPQESTPKVILGALNKALVRTFRGDLAQSLDNNEAEIQKYLPQTNEVKKDSVNQTQDNTPHNDAIVHTFSDDVQHLVRNKKMSMVRAVALESNKKGAGEQAVVQGPWRTVLLVLFIALALIVVAVVAAGGYYAYRLNVGTPSTYELNPGILFTEGRERIEIGGNTAQQTAALFAALRASTYFSLGALTEFYITETPASASIGEPVTPVHIGARAFLEHFAARVPESFLQTLGSEYMVGIYTTDDGNMPFLVLTTTSYSYAFNGLLEWETHMLNDLRSSFVPSKETPHSSGFVDEIYDNIDVRVLYNSFNKPFLMYGFVDRTTFVIATDKRTLLEVISRARIHRP